MDVRTALRFATAIAGVALCMIGHAQTMYRCGNTYQDHPCDNADSQKVVGSTATHQPSTGAGADPAAASGLTDSRCRLRGIAAEKIMWAREGGATLQQQTTSPNQSVNVALATDVYQRRGSAAEVRVAVEKDCAAEAARALEAARLNAAAAAIAGEQSPDKDAPARSVVSSAAGSAPQNNSATAAAAARTSRCNQLAVDAKNITSQQHSGATAAAMQGLDDRARQNQTDRAASGC